MPEPPFVRAYFTRCRRIAETRRAERKSLSKALLARHEFGCRLCHPRERKLSSRAIWFRRSLRPGAPLTQQIINLLFQQRQIILDGAPDNIDVHVKVIVNHLIAHASHFDPRQFRVGRHKFRRVLLKLAGGLANDFDIANEGILIVLALPKGAHAVQTLMYPVAR